MKESENVDGEDETYVKIDADSKKTNGIKTLKEMKEYLRSEFEKKDEWRYRNIGGTYLHFAAYLGDVDATKRLIQDNADVNAVNEKKLTALHEAALEGHVEIVKVLIQNGADVNAVNYWKQTALHYAALKGHADVAKVLLEKGADVNAVDK
jgi:ankyrin repeat protein